MSASSDQAVQACMEMIMMVKELKDLTTQEEPQVPQKVLNFLANLSTTLLPKLLLYIFCSERLDETSRDHEFVALVTEYAKKLEKPTAKYEIDIVKATANGRYAQVSIEILGQTISLARVCKVHHVGSTIVQVQYKVKNVGATRTPAHESNESNGDAPQEKKGKETNIRPFTGPERHPPKAGIVTYPNGARVEYIGDFQVWGGIIRIDSLKAQALRAEQRRKDLNKKPVSKWSYSEFVYAERWGEEMARALKWPTEPFWELPDGTQVFFAADGEGTEFRTSLHHKVRAHHRKMKRLASVGNCEGDVPEPSVNAGDGGVRQE